jgi:dTDP-4-amino-4,6-dideoxygalactose transaminase
MKRFQRSFTQQEPIPEEAVERALAVLRGGRLHRYNVVEGETAEAALLEQEFAHYLGVDYCLACASGGYAMHLALCVYGIKPGAAVLTNAFTLSPVPGAIHNAGGRPVLVETDAALVIDLADLEKKIDQSGARLLLLSHMRGHIVDMEALCALLENRGVALIEDCAHTMGASWGGRKSGTFGIAACFSTQTYKHLNSGEGGLLTSNDPELMARAVVRSGSYMFYERHLAAPDPSVYAELRLHEPNCSGRMDNLRASILRPQLARLDDSVERWNARYRAIAEVLATLPGLRLPERPSKEQFVGSSIQFLVENFDGQASAELLARCSDRGVELKWFGAQEPVGYTSRYHHWRYMEQQALPATDAVLAGLFDMRIPLTFEVDDCRLIGEIIGECLSEVRDSMRNLSAVTP